MLIFTGCEKEGISRIGFDTSINGSSNGTTNMKVREDSGRLTLSGTVTLTEGQLLLELLDPDGINAWSNSYQGPVEADVDEFFNAKKGTWTLNYTSVNASGHIDVHLNN
jgi:hypothetical protein